MPAKKPLVLENRSLRVEVDRRDLAAHVTVKSTGETLRMAEPGTNGKASPARRSICASPGRSWPRPGFPGWG